MATATLSSVLDFAVPRVFHFGQMVGHVVFTIPVLASAALYTSCDLMTLGTHDYFLKSLGNHSLTLLPPKSLAQESTSAQARIDECAQDIVFSLIRIVNPAAKVHFWLAEYFPQSQSTVVAKQFSSPYFSRFDHISAGRVVPHHCPTRLFNWVLMQQLKSNDYYLNGSRLNVRARLFSIASGVVLAIIGIACVIFGAFATIGALAFSFVKVDGINDYAVNLIGLIGFTVNQLHQGVIGFFRPSHLVSPACWKKNQYNS